MAPCQFHADDPGPNDDRAESDPQFTISTLSCNIRRVRALPDTLVLMLPRFTIGIPKIYEYNRKGNDTMLPAIILDMRDTARRTLAEGRGPESVCEGEGLVVIPVCPFVKRPSLRIRARLEPM